jgi:hypothetical protein
MQLQAIQAIDDPRQLHCREETGYAIEGHLSEENAGCQELGLTR